MKVLCFAVEYWLLQLFIAVIGASAMYHSLSYLNELAAGSGIDVNNSSPTHCALILAGTQLTLMSIPFVYALYVCHKGK